MKNSVKLFGLIAFILVIASCGSDKTSTKEDDKNGLKKLEIPSNYELLTESEGDLDGDGENEKIYVYNTDKEDDLGFERLIYICKKQDNEWMQWKLVKGPVMASASGGMMGDPFEDLIIDKGKIYITHFGGSSQKWYYNHCFEFIEDEFRLTEAVVDYGIACVQWETYRFNLVSGKLTYDLAPDYCDDVLFPEYTISEHKEFEIEKTELPLMNGFDPGNNQLVASKDYALYY